MMKTTYIAAAIATAALTLCSGAYAQSSTSSDTTGSASMPAEITPSHPADEMTPDSAMTPAPAANESGTSQALPSSEVNSSAIENTYQPTRSEVAGEAAAMNKSSSMPRGQETTKDQGMGAQRGTTPN